MFIIFRPGRVLFAACLIGLAGVIAIDGSIYHSPLSYPLYFMLIFGILLIILALWIALTALRFIWRAVRIFFGGSV
jgi:hypothetical protein